VGTGPRPPALSLTRALWAEDEPAPGFAPPDEPAPNLNTEFSSLIVQICVEPFRRLIGGRPAGAQGDGGAARRCAHGRRAAAAGAARYPVRVARRRRGGTAP